MGKPTRPRRGGSGQRTTTTRCWCTCRGHHASRPRRSGATIATLPAHLRGSLTGTRLRNGPTSNSRWPPTCPSTSATQPALAARHQREHQRLLRQYFPKGTDLSVFSTRPRTRRPATAAGARRKTLDWDTQPSACVIYCLTNHQRCDDQKPPEHLGSFTSARGVTVSRGWRPLRRCRPRGSAIRGWSPRRGVRRSRR